MIKASVISGGVTLTVAFIGGVALGFYIHTQTGDLF
jgi:hypothetical protein